MAESKKGYSYGKRPIWQWVLIYVVVGIVLSGLIYYFVIAKNGGYNSTYGTSPQTNQQNSGY